LATPRRDRAWRAGAATTDRRRFVAGGLVGAAAALGLAAKTSFDAYAVNPFAPRLERIALALPPAHAHLASLTIGFVADTHVGPYVAADDVRRALALLTPTTVDLALFGGDYISESTRYAPASAATLAEYAAATRLGGWAVLGNHDAAWGRGDRVAAALEDRGITVLRNAAASIETGRGSLWIAGIDDVISGRPDPRATFAGIPAGAAAIALWHEPDYAEQAAAHGAFVQFSGHSHGGQIRLPGVGPVILPRGGQRFVMGWHEAGGMPIYTTRGVGVYRPPFRLNCPPEVTLITLTSSASGHPA
jgi:hypothetical protein